MLSNHTTAGAGGVSQSIDYWFKIYKHEALEKQIDQLTSELEGREAQLLKSFELLINDENFNITKLKEVPEDSIEIKDDIRDEIRRKLRNVIKLSFNQEIQSSPMSTYGLDYDGKLRFILLLLKQGICPHPQKLKQAIYGEANYGSYVNAEILIFVSMKLRSLEYYKDDEWDDCLRRSFNSVVRFAPKPSVALFYFNIAKIAVPNTYQEVLAALLFNIALALPEDSIIEDIDIQNEQDLLINLINYYMKIGCSYYPRSRLTDKKGDNRQVFNGVVEVIKYKLRNIEKLRAAFTKENNEFIQLLSENDQDDLMSILTGVSNVDTTMIEVDISNLAKKAMAARNIFITDVQRCLKHGDSKASKYEVKATDDNLIVFYIKKHRIPYVTNVYKHITKQNIQEIEQGGEKLTVFDLCDALLTCIIYGDHTDYQEITQKMLKISPLVSPDEYDALHETLQRLFTDALPSYEHVLSITKLMEHFKIVYRIKSY